MSRRLTLIFLCVALFSLGVYLGFRVADRRQRCVNAIYTINQFLFRSRFASEPTKLERLENSLLIGSVTELQRMPRWVRYFIALGEPDSDKRQTEKTIALADALRRAGASLPDDQLRDLVQDYLGRHHTYEAPKSVVDAVNDLRHSQSTMK